MNSDLDRVLGQIDTLLPPGAPDDDWSVSPDAMRWAPTDQDDHPDLERGFPRYLPTPGSTRWDIAFGQPSAPIPDPDNPGATVSEMRALLYLGAAAAVFAGFASAMRSAVRAAEHLSYNLAEVLARLEAADHLGLLDTDEDRASAVIEARRTRNTGPGNPHGLDGRARRRHHPTRTATPTATARDEFRWVSWSDVRARRHGYRAGGVPE